MQNEENREITAETLIRSIQSILLVYDRDGELLTWNDAAGSTLGLGAPKSQGGKPRLSSELSSAVRHAMDNMAMMRVDSCAVKVGDEQRKFGFTANPLEEDGKVVGAVVTGRDITERMRVTEEIEDLKRRAGVEKVARQVAHELRNPLNSIKIHSQYLELTFPEGDPSRHYARIISEEVDKMDRLLGHLRDLSRAQDLDLRFGSPEEALTASWELMRPVAKAKGIDIKLRLDPLPNILHDAGKLQQVFVNLLKNAVEAVKPGEHVLFRGGSTPNGGMYAEVLDDGPGIDPEVADHVFDPFFSTKGRSGEGLGLSICQEIVERHRGVITLLAEAEWSTCFRVEIPPP